MFNIAPEKHPAYQAMLSYDKLRYRLLPYIYSLAGMVTQEDYTIMRALVMDFGDDQQVLNIGDQFMLGPALLVNPVTEYKARSRAVYLPAGTGWYDLKSGQHFAGGQTIQAAAPYSDIPLFVREGAIIPFGPEIQYVDEKPADPLILYVYTGQDGRFELYEDENDNNNYIKGQFTVIPLTYSEQLKSLTIGQHQGAFSGMLSQRTIWIIWVDPAKKVGLNFDRQPDAVVRYDGAEVKVKMY
jgi:alpha-D-xyloside xylohydrolase